MSAPTQPAPVERRLVACPICGADATYSATSEVLELYADGPGAPGDRRRLTTAPTRTMVPGRTTERWEPCGHVRVIPEQLETWR